MAKTSQIEAKLRAWYGNLHEVIPKLVSEHGQEETARLLGVKQAWVSRWLRREGYRQVSRWERCSERS